MTSSGRLFVIHAGTHKTATSYIQNRMELNVKQLAAAGVYVRYPKTDTKKYKPLAKSLHARDWEKWQQYLDSIPASSAQVLISSEHFTQPLADPDVFTRLVQILNERGFQLRIVVFLRDQPDYMNARYVHSTRRLYHYLGFEEYVGKQLAEERHVFDYSYLFSGLLGCPDLQTCFLPFRSGLGDPFERLMQSQGWSTATSWAPADPSQANIQPGIRGVWLAQEVARRLAQRRIKPSVFRNKSIALRSITEREGWDSERYYGFTPELQDRVVAHYADSNDQFSQRVWGKPWRDVFPRQQPQRCVYSLPDDKEECRKMRAFIREALSKLSRDGSRDS